MERRPRRAPSRRPPPGSDPSTLVSKPRAHHAELRVVHYDEAHHEEASLDDVEALRPWLARPGIAWIHVVAPSDADLAALGSLLRLHPLALSNIAHVPQRPRWQSFVGHDVLLLRAVDSGTTADQVSVVIGDRWVLSVDERPGDPFDVIRQRLRDGVGTIRTRSPSFLAGALVLALVEGFYPCVEKLLDDVDRLTDRVVERTSVPIEEMQRLRQRLVDVRHAAWPTRAALTQAAGDDSPLLQPEARLLLEEAAHDMSQVLGMLEAAQSSVAAMGDLLMNVLSWRTNEVMGLLTVVSTIFLPMTFLAGVWGMNFDTDKPGNMPELEWPFGYVLAWTAMLVSASVILIYLRYRGWLSMSQLRGHRSSARRAAATAAPS